MDQLNLVPLTEVKKEEVLRCLENNLIALSEALTPLPDFTFVDEPDIMYVTSALPGPRFSGVIRSMFSEASADERIDEIEAIFKAKHVPLFYWQVWPWTQPADLGERLAVRGYLPMYIDAPAMVVELDAAIHELSTLAVIDGLHISRVSNDEDMNAWGEAFWRGYEIPEMAGQSWVDGATYYGGGGKTPWFCYLVRQHQQPVASGMMMLGGGVAGIYNVATIPEARRQGIAAQVMRVMLKDALDAGYSYSVLTSSNVAERLYATMGYERAGVMSGYIWIAPGF